MIPSNHLKIIPEKNQSRSKRTTMAPTQGIVDWLNDRTLLRLERSKPIDSIRDKLNPWPSSDTSDYKSSPSILMLPLDLNHLLDYSQMVR